MKVSGNNNNGSPLMPLKENNQKQVGKKGGKKVKPKKVKKRQVNTPGVGANAARPRKRTLQERKVSFAPGKKCILNARSAKKNQAKLIAGKKGIPGKQDDKENKKPLSADSEKLKITADPVSSNRKRKVSAQKARHADPSFEPQLHSKVARVAQPADNKTSAGKAGENRFIAGQTAVPGRNPISTSSAGELAGRVDSVERGETANQAFVAWGGALKEARPYTDAVVKHLFGENYPAADETEVGAEGEISSEGKAQLKAQAESRAKAEAKARVEALLADPESNLAKLEKQLLDTWKKTASPAHLDVLRSKLKDKLLFAWQRMEQGDLYKLQMVVESLCLQSGGGHHQSQELKAFIQNEDEIIERYRDGFIYDGTNAVDSSHPEGAVNQSLKKVVSIESTYRGSEPGVVRNESNIPDITVSNLGDSSGIHVEHDLVIKNAEGKVLKDSVAFSDGTYSFHGASVEMELRDKKIADQLKSENPNQDSEFSARIRAYITHHLSHGRDMTDLAITGDANVCLFDDDPATGGRSLKPGVQEILNEHKLALIVPSGKVTWGRPISDQLHKNATASELSGYRDTMLLMVPVTGGNLSSIRELGNDPALKQDTFFPLKTLEGEAINPAESEPESIIHQLSKDRNQFSCDPTDRVMTDHAILVGPKHIVGNTADCKGVGTEGKSLTFDKAGEVWGDERPTYEQYKELAGNTARVLSELFNDVITNEVKAKEKGA